MAKKDFKDGIKSRQFTTIIGGGEKREEQSENSPEAKEKLSSEEAYIPRTFKIRQSVLADIDVLTWWSREEKQKFVEKAILAYIEAMPEEEVKKARTEYAKSQGK